MDKDDFVGIVDAAAVLRERLPSVQDLTNDISIAEDDDSTVGLLQALMPQQEKKRLKQALINLLGDPEKPEEVLDKVGMEIALQLATDQRLLRDFEAQINTVDQSRRAARNSTTARTMFGINRRFRAVSVSPTLKELLKKGQPRVETRRQNKNELP
jgi:hypothetical protein